MVYRTAPFSMTLTPNPRVQVMVRVRGRVKKVRKLPKLSNGTTYNDLE